MATHTVRQGECLSSIARSYGFTDWRRIYDHPLNAEFKKKRPNPNVIYPGDEIFIPDHDLKTEPRETEKKHKFRLKAQKTLVRIVLEDGSFQPLANKKYKLTVENRTYEGRTNANGLIQHTIPADAETGLLTAWLGDDDSGVGYVWEVRLGHLDPVEELTGIQARLNNLSFDCGAVDGIYGPFTRSGVEAFQKKYGLQVDGIPGPITQAKLEEVHGC